MPSYIIDRDYRLLYFDPVTKLRFPKVKAGEVCSVSYTHLTLPTTPYV